MKDRNPIEETFNELDNTGKMFFLFLVSAILNPNLTKELEEELKKEGWLDPLYSLPVIIIYFKIIFATSYKFSCII